MPVARSILEIIGNTPLVDISPLVEARGLRRRLLVEGYLRVTDQEATDGARALAREAGVFAGFSTGANLAATYQILANRESGKTIVFLVGDSGLKYLSTNLFP